MFTQFSKTVLLAGIIIAAATGAFFYSQHNKAPHNNIYEFNPSRDTKAMMDIFHKNWYWLLASDESSPAFMLKYRTWDTNPAHFGLMKIKVLRENDKLAGFTTYYMETPERGRLLFLAVDENFRSKGYGSTLMKHAVNELFKMGATHIALWTRVSNLPAQRIYRAFGFQEVREENGYLYFEYWPQE